MDINNFHCQIRERHFGWMETSRPLRSPFLIIRWNLSLRCVERCATCTRRRGSSIATSHQTTSCWEKRTKSPSVSLPHITSTSPSLCCLSRKVNPVSFLSPWSWLRPGKAETGEQQADVSGRHHPLLLVRKFTQYFTPMFGLRRFLL